MYISNNVTASEIYKKKNKNNSTKISYRKIDKHYGLAICSLVVVKCGK